MNQPSNHDLTITRVLDAPIELVWQAWTNPAILQQWWGPRGFTSPTCEWEAQPGGKINVVMLGGPNMGEFSGMRAPMRGKFTEVVPQQKLVFDASPLDADDQPLMDTVTTVSLEPQGQQTKLTLQVVVTRTTPAAEGPLSGMEAGWSQSLDKLAEQLEEEKN